MKSGKKSKCEILQILSASAEGRVGAGELLREIEPLIGDYFVAETFLEEEKIIIALYNGQRFILKIEEEQK